LTLLIVLACLIMRIMTLESSTMVADSFTRTHLRIDALMIGVFLNHLVRTRSYLVTWIEQHSRGALFIAGALILSASSFNRVSPYMFTVGFPMLSVGFSILLLLIYHGLLKPIESNFLMTGMAKVGCWSYNIYLWHYFILLLPIPFYEFFNDLLAREIHSTGLLIAAQASLFFITSISLGALMTYLVESPFLKIRNHFYPSSISIISSKSKKQESSLRLRMETVSLKLLLKKAKGIQSYKDRASFVKSDSHP
jgi:peptidoglycan/LPS O-acetylase OafA/YrhL